MTASGTPASAASALADQPVGPEQHKAHQQQAVDQLLQRPGHRGRNGQQRDELRDKQHEHGARDGPQQRGCAAQEHIDRQIEGGVLVEVGPVQVTRAELPAEEMYMSGRLLFPLTAELTTLIRRGLLPTAATAAGS